MRAVILLFVAAIAACDAKVEELDNRPAGYASEIGRSHFGCWVLHWSPNEGVPTHGILVFPDSVYLSVGIQEDGRRRVEPATSAEGRSFDATRDDWSQMPWEAHFRWNWWWLEGDSAVILFSDGGYVYWRLRLGLSERELRGQAEYQSDTGPGDPPLTAEVVGTPFPCFHTF